MAVWKEMQKIPQLIYDQLAAENVSVTKLAKEMPIKCTQAAVIREMKRRGLKFKKTTTLEWVPKKEGKTNE